jgi:hypothetical protein
MKTLSGIVLTMLALSLAACAGTPDTRTIEERMAERGYLIGPADQNIPRYRINSWSSVNDRYLTVRSGVNDHYLIELMQPCFGLESAFSIGIGTPTTRVDRFGSVLVRDIDGRVERCRIDNIYLLDRVE